MIPEQVLGLAPLGGCILKEVGHKPLDIVIGLQIHEGVIAMAFLHVDEIQYFDGVSPLFQKVATVPEHFAFGIQHHITAGSIHKARLGEEAGFTCTGTSAA